MTSVNRRTVIKGAMGAGAALSLPSGLSAADRRPVLFIADRRFAASRAAALERTRQGVTVIDQRDQDLGIAWRSTIPALLERSGRVVEGVTLWSDFVICETFGRSYGLEIMAPFRPIPENGDRLRHWKLG